MAPTIVSYVTFYVFRSHYFLCAEQLIYPKKGDNPDTINIESYIITPERLMPGVRIVYEEKASFIQISIIGRRSV